MLYRFQIEVSDVDRGLYTSLDFRISQHPSETGSYLLTRVLAYVLSYQQGLEFSTAGLSDPDSPALLALGKNGTNDLIIEIGNPSARRLHKSMKNSKRLVVYTYKSPEVLINDIKTNEVHRADEIEIHAFDSDFLESLEACLQKNNRWSLLQQQGQLDIEADGKAITGQVKSFKPL